MAEPQKKPDSGHKPDKPHKPSKEASDTPWLGLGRQSEEILFFILVAAFILSMLIGFFQSGRMRAFIARIFYPTSLSYYDSATGARVFVSALEANVRESPGGIRIGGQPNGAAGTVIEGPVSALKRFWNIDFDSSPDGWVDEDELKLFKPQTLVSRIVSGVIGFFKLSSTFLSLLFLSGIIYSVIRTAQLKAEQRKHEKKQGGHASSDVVVVEHANRRWERVIAHVQSENPSDWRLAILEADIMLAELLDRMGYAGENVGEKLKTIEQSDFNTIDQAWEAHKIRNLIAHQGSDYLLSQREAQRVIGLYTNVFREFRYV